MSCLASGRVSNLSVSRRSCWNLSRETATPMRRYKNYPLTRLAQAATDELPFPPRALWALRLKPRATARLEYVEATARTSAHAWLRLPDGSVAEPDARPRDLPAGFERFANLMERDVALRSLADAEALR